VESQPVVITQAMKTAREDPDAKLRRRNGIPYRLESGSELFSTSRDGNVLIVGEGTEKEMTLSLAKVQASARSWQGRIYIASILRFPGSGEEPPLLFFFIA
jgi:hypothetical protein